MCGPHASHDPHSLISHILVDVLGNYILDSLGKGKSMLVGFDKWWQEDGKMIDPDTEDVPWFDKRKALAELAFEAGIKCGMARAANYVASDSQMPDRVEFANGTQVYKSHLFV
jgi:hypothetical protein